jgi:hypothetical protein
VLITALPHTVSRTRDARAEATSMTEANLQGHAKDAANLIVCSGTMA